MADYLVDANHVTAFSNKEPNVIQRLANVPAQTLFFLSKIIRGELEGGHRLTVNADPVKVAAFWTFVGQQFNAIDPTDDTSRYYGEIIGRLSQNHTRKAGTKVERWLTNIGVQTNDVWFVAEAWSHNLICLTSDKMEKIKAVVTNDVVFDNWR